MDDQYKECVKLTKRKQHIMIKNGLPGETGANPVRARRRKVHIVTVILPNATVLGKAIGVSLRRPVNGVPSRNIRTDPILNF